MPVPPVKDPPDPLYQGERIDLDKVLDLGLYLRDVQKQKKLAPVEVDLPVGDFGAPHLRWSGDQHRGSGMGEGSARPRSLVKVRSRP